jgi:hypothetical protein
MASGTKSAPPPPLRRGGPATLAELLPAVSGTAFRKFGFRQATLATHWREVVGPLYARWSVPEAIRSPRGASGGPVLHILVEGPFATQMLHVEPRIVERCNRLLGPGTIGRIRLRQGVVPRRTVLAEPPPVADRAAPAANLAGVHDPELRLALERLAGALAAGAAPT